MRTYIPMRHTMQVSRVTGNDAFGKPVTGPTFTVRCQVIRAIDRRTDTALGVSSGSAGHAAEEIADFEVMLRGVDVRMHDIVVYNGRTYAIKSIDPQFDIYGNVDHTIARGEIEQA